MNPRTTGILFLVAVALGAFIVFYELEGEEGRKRAEERTQQLFSDIDADDIEWMALTTSDGTKVRARRSDEGWMLTEPLEFPADEFAFDGMASALANMTSVAVYDEPRELEVYGLDDEALEVRFGAGDAEYKLRTGDKAPVGGNAYVWIPGEEAVYMVSLVGTNGLRKAFDDLREKRLLRFDPDSVEAFTASWPGGRVDLVRGEEGWAMTAPVEGPADQQALDDVLSALSFLRAVGFQDKHRGDAAVGLVEPAYAVELKLAPKEEGGDPRSLSLEIGSVELDGVLHARTASPSLYWIDPARLDAFPTELDAYRHRQLADFEPGAAKRVELAFESEEAGQSYVVTATAGEEGWSSSPDPMAPERIQRLVDELSDLEAQRILAERVGPEELKGFGLSPANATFLVYDEADALLAKIRLGTIRDSEGIVAQTGENAQVFEISLELAEQLPVSLEAFQNRFIEAPEEDTEAETEANPAP